MKDMTLKTFLKNRKAGYMDQEELFHSSVCIPLIQTEDGYEMLFEVRSSRLADQPGDVCFPGGRVEQGETYEQAALRECCEELLISKEQIEVLGEWDRLWTGKLLIHTFVILLKDYENTYNEENEMIFRVPLRTLKELPEEVYELERRPVLPEKFPYDRIVGGKNYKWRSHKNTIYFYEAGGHTIWGITAKILRSFLNGTREQL